MPRITYTDETQIPTDLRQFAVREGNTFVVDVVPATSFATVRDSLTQAQRDKEAIEARLQAFSQVSDDPQKLRARMEELETIAAAVKDGSLKTTPDVESEISRRLAEAKTAYETQVRELGKNLDTVKRERDEATQRYQATQVQNAIRDAALAADSGVNPSALPDVIARAMQVYRYHNGKVVPMQGDAVIYGVDGVTPMPPREWLAKLLKEAPYFGLASVGAGTGTRIGNMTPEQIAALSPAQRINLARTGKI